MSASDNSNATSFRWELIDLKRQRDNAKPNGLMSGPFSLQNRPLIQFALVVSPLNNYISFDHKNGIRVILKRFDNSLLEASIKLWIENTAGRKFGETFVEKHLFSKIEDEFGYDGFFGEEKTNFYILYRKHETFYICCELIDLNALESSVINCDQAFRQNQWALYENEKFCDAIVKVGEKNFKVSKIFLAAQSKVFESMFLSNFKEGITSTIEVKDVEERTMKHLIKWLYTSKFDNDAPIEKLFTAADKYDIKVLKTICVQFMIYSLSENNAFSRLVLSSFYNNNELKSAALEFISKLSKGALVEMFASDEYHELKSKNPALAKEVKELIRNKLD